MAINLCNYAGGRISNGGAMPNWKEAFEWALTRGGVSCLNVTVCNFCVLAGHADKGSRTGKGCSDCPLNVVNSKGTDTCASIKLDNSERRAICRHVLAPGMIKDWTDRDEIRARISEMLDDDAREKFLGKPAVKCYGPGYDVESAEGYQYLTGGDKANPKPKLLFYIKEARSGAEMKLNDGVTILACRDEATRDLVLAFLNGETK